MLESVLSVIVMTLGGALAGLLLGGMAYGIAFLIGLDFGIGSIFIVSGVLSIVFFFLALVNEMNLR